MGGLIGEYGPDHNILYILEKDGKLHALIEWVFVYPLKEFPTNVYKFPDFGLYQGDKLVFTRNRDGKATSVEAASVPFRRRAIAGEDGSTFTIKPVRPLVELRRLALTARPPEEKNALFRKPELADLTRLDKTIKLDIRYAGTNNFPGRTLLHFRAGVPAEARGGGPGASVIASWPLKGFGLLIHDAYRPWYVTKMFWDATPDEASLVRG